MRSMHVKPLFHEKTLAKALAHYPGPENMESRREIVNKWVRTLKEGTLDAVKETSLHGEFLRDIFGDVLGYRSVIQGEGKEWTLHAETTITDGGGSADGAIGFFTAVESGKGGKKLKGRVFAPIELKGATNDLDRPASGRHESAVQQGWGYANYTAGCRWVIVSNYREIRLYRTSKTPAVYERFFLEDLAGPEEFRRFSFLLSSFRFLPVTSGPDAESHLDQLLRQSDCAEVEITEALYSEYKETRQRLVRWLDENGPEGVGKNDLIEAAQKVLDRVLFIAFCEDRDLLPPETLKNAHDHDDPYNPMPIWNRYKAVFGWVDHGHDDPPIPGYNGGLFKHDPLVDERITVPDELCSALKAIARYDYDTDVSVEILGRIFEQSVNDIEELKASAAGTVFDKKKGKRKTQGVYYTPAFVTQYIVKLALGGYLHRRAEELRLRLGLDTIPEAQGKKLRAAERKFWEVYRDEVLKRTRVLDPACGSGAFLIAAFDHLHAEYDRVNRTLASFEKGQTTFEDLNKTILGGNLFGVDISKESVEITKLSLWLKTAERGELLTFLDDNIQQGNSIVDDRTVDRDAFDWDKRFPKVFEDGGFDVVIGNPPYVRQEMLGPIKPYLKEHYDSFDGAADLYVYFYERGIEVLKPGGLLSYIVTNKWLKAGYGEALRGLFAKHTVFEQIIDFGHAPIFQDADVFPCVVLARKPEADAANKDAKREASHPVTVCSVPREKLGDFNLEQFVSEHGYEVPWGRLSEKSWSLDPPAVDALMEKIRHNGVPLAEFAGSDPYVGLKTGLNEAYLVDDAVRKEMLAQHPEAQVLFRPYLRGQDIRRWSPDCKMLWMILLSSSINTAWPWREAQSEEVAEIIFERTFPSVFHSMKEKQDRLAGRSDQGQFWWELRSCAYLNALSMPKIIWQDLSFHSRFCLDIEGTIPEMTCFFLPTNDPWLLAVMNSPLMWCYLWRNTIHGKDEVLRLKTVYMSHAPIAKLDPCQTSEVEDAVGTIIDATKSNASAQRDLLAWLKAEMVIDKPGEAMSKAALLDLDTFLAEIHKRRPKAAGKLGVNDVKAIQQAWSDIVPAMQKRNSGTLRLERRLSDLVNQAYGLIPDEIDLLWGTAPPRMPVGRGQSRP